MLEAYGALLTERQREFVRLHCHKDLSFGEIAREFGVSRQAVHDAVRQAEITMEQYEARLGLLVRSAGKQIVPAAEKLKPIIEKVAALRRRLATQGIIYDTTDYLRALDELLALLREQAGG